jgi:hypothetical protein
LAVAFGQRNGERQLPPRFAVNRSQFSHFYRDNTLSSGDYLRGCLLPTAIEQADLIAHLSSQDVQKMMGLCLG